MFRIFQPENGALGHGHYLNALKPVPVKALEDKRFVAVTAGDFYTHALDEDGDLYSWGRGEY